MISYSRSATDGAASAPRCGPTSAASTAPSGPEPRTLASEIPASAASRRALGEASGSFPTVDWAACDGACAAPSSEAELSATGDATLWAAAAAPLGALSPSASNTATTCPTGDLVALLGADVRQGSRSRSFELEYRLVGFDLHHGLALFYELSLGLEPADENAGVLGHLDRRHDDFNCHGSSLAPEHFSGNADNALSIRNCLVFQSRSERNRYIHRCYAPHWGVKVIKRLLGYDRPKLSRCAESPVTFVEDDAAGGFLCRRHQCFFVERRQCSGVNHLRLDPFLGQLAGRFERDVNHAGSGDDCKVLPSRFVSATPKGIAYSSLGSGTAPFC